MKYALRLTWHAGILVFRVLGILLSASLSLLGILSASQSRGQDTGSDALYDDGRPGPWNMTRTERYHYDPDGYQDYRHQFYGDDN